MEKNQELKRFFEGFVINEEIRALISIINVPDDEEVVLPLEAQDERPPLSPEKYKALGKLNSRIVAYSVRYVDSLEQIGKKSQFDTDSLMRLLYNYLISK